MYFQKNNITQILPPGIYTPDDFANYADNFDLSLLSNDGEVPLSPQSQITSQSNENSYQLQSTDYIPTTVSAQIQRGFYENNNQLLTPTHSPQHQNYHQPMKTESDWLKYSMNEAPRQYNEDFFNQLTDNYHYPSPLPSPPQENQYRSTSIYPPSPSNSSCSSASPHSSVDYNSINFTIKQEFGIQLPPSPPDSNGVPSPFHCCEIKTEPETDSEVCIDLESLLNESYQISGNKKQKQQQPQDHQLLREYLQDTSFQKKHNLKPLALESLIGGWSTRGDIEPVFSLALEQIRKDVQDTCAILDIPPDPQLWTSSQVHSWLRSQISLWKLEEISNIEMVFPETGIEISQLSEEEFVRRVPQSGATLYAQLVVWKGACTEVETSHQLSETNSLMLNAIKEEWDNMIPTTPQNTLTDLSDDEDEDMPHEMNSPTTATTLQANVQLPTTSKLNNDTNGNSTSTGNVSTNPTTSTPRTGRQGGSHIHLWQFLKELLASPQTHGTAIRWLDRTKGVFKIEDSVRVARLWGRRKNRPAMNYDKLSRSIRQYYKKGIMKKTERSQRLVYQFCHPYCL